MSGVMYNQIPKLKPGTINGIWKQNVLFEVIHRKY
jgi:hypothetical protein